jgi:hexokinase
MSAHGGLRRGEDRYGVEAGPMVGFILGTGFNTAYPEKRIPKIGFDAPANPQIVVCESGNFAHRYMGFLDKEYDSTTKNPGTYSLEKACSGAYIGPLTFHIIKQALNDGLFTFRRADEFIASSASLLTRDLNEFMHEPLTGTGPIGGLFAKDEMDALASFAYLTSIVTERGALFSAAVLAATILRTNASYEPFSPVRVAVEGTTYLVYKGMRRSLESYLHQMLFKEKPRPYVVYPVEQASLFGAAVAALTKEK